MITSITHAIQTALKESISIIKGELHIKVSEWNLEKIFFKVIQKLSPIPDPPTTEDPANFDERADLFLASLPNLQRELNEMIDELNKLSSDIFVTNNNIEAINNDFKPNLEEAKKYINEMLMKIELLRNDYEKNTAVLAGDKYTYSREYLDDMFSRCINALNHYSKLQVDDLLKDKADKSNSYLKKEIDKLLELKANSVDVLKKDQIYLKAEIDKFLAKKANAGDSYKKAETYTIKDLYTKTEVDNKVAGIVNKAPAGLDTLGELSKALGNDPNFAVTISDKIAKKANAGDSYIKSVSDDKYALKSDLSSYMPKGDFSILAGLVIKSGDCTTKRWTRVNFKEAFSTKCIKVIIFTEEGFYCPTPIVLDGDKGGFATPNYWYKTQIAGEQQNEIYPKCIYIAIGY